MSKAFVFVTGGVRSRDYANVGNCVKDGLRIIREPGSEYRVALEGHNFGIPRTYDGASKRARVLLKDKPFGTTVRVQSLESKDVVRFRKVEFEVVADTPGVLGIDRWAGYLNTEFAGNGTFRYAGICVCKANSDHRDCAACDNFDTWENMEEQAATARRRADYFNTKYIILGRTIWSGPNLSPSYYSGNYHGHVHISVFGGINGAAC